MKQRAAVGFGAGEARRTARERWRSINAEELPAVTAYASASTLSMRRPPRVFRGRLLSRPRACSPAMRARRKPAKAELADAALALRFHVDRRRRGTKTLARGSLTRPSNRIAPVLSSVIKNRNGRSIWKRSTSSGRIARVVTTTAVTAAASVPSSATSITARCTIWSIVDCASRARLAGQPERSDCAGSNTLLMPKLVERRNQVGLELEFEARHRQAPPCASSHRGPIAAWPSVLAPSSAGDHLVEAAAAHPAARSSSTDHPPRMADRIAA